MALLADALAQRGVAVVYVANSEMSADRQQQGWRPPTLRYAQLKIAPDTAAVKKMVAAAPSDSIHLCQGVRGNGLVRITQQQLRRRGLQYCAIIETVDDDGWRGVLKRLVYRTLLWFQRNKISGILAIGANTSAWIAARGFPALRIFSFAYFLQQPDLKSSVRASYSKAAQSRFQFIYVGQLIERKRVDDLISALVQLDREDVELTIVGNGPLENELRQQAKRFLPGRVRWLGQLPMSEIPALVAQADCLVLPSRHDGWGAVISEALMVGTPVVCSDACGASIAVRASGVGSVFPANHRPALRAALAEQIQSGKWSEHKRAQLSAWAACLNAGSGAEYLQKILNYDQLSSERPSAPWLNE